MRFLLTGATGFLGSAILKKLLQNGHEAIIIKRSFSDISRIKDKLSQIKSYDMDKTSVEAIFKENKEIDTIIHTATSYGRKNETQENIFETNITFPLALLDNASKNDVKTFINTDTVLPLCKKGTMHNYVFSKKSFLKQARSYFQRINFINIKFDYIYGPFDDKTKFLPFLIENCMRNVPEIKLTKGEQKRDFIYIDDAVNAYMKIIETKKTSCTNYEAGTGCLMPLKECALQIKEASCSFTKLNFGAIPYREDELMETKINISNLLKIGWKPEYTFMQGIKKLLSLENGEAIK